MSGRASRALTRLEPAAYAALRIVAGGLLIQHGAQKLFGLLGGHVMPTGSQLWFGGIIELVGGALVAIGLCTRAAAFLCSGLLAVAYFQFHWKLRLGLAFFPAVNQGELAVVYCFVFLLIATRGGGRLSVDGWRARR
jgi:putative oxidoreductase